MLLILFIDYSSNSKKIAEDEQYIIRHYVTASLFDDFNEKRIYKKQGIVEKYIGSFDGSDIIPHKRHEIHSFHIDESKNVFIGHYHSLLNAKDTVMSFPIVKSNNWVYNKVDTTANAVPHQTIKTSNDMDILKKLSKYFIISLAILFVCSFVVLVDKFHKIENDVFDVLETYKALKYFFILGASAFTASVAYSMGIAALFAFDKLKVQTWKDFARKLAAGLLLVIPLSAMVYYCDWFVYP